MIFQKPALKPANSAGPLEHTNPARISLTWLLRLGIALALGWNTSLLAALGSGNVTLAWAPSPSPDIAGYHVLYGVASGIYTYKVSAGNTNSVTLSNLVAGTTYYFAVTCYNTAGDESAPSNEAVYTVPADLTGLPAVLGTASFSAGRFSFNVSNNPGTNFAVEASVDLIHWIRVATNTSPFTYVDANASQFAQRFYRTVILPGAAPSDPVVPENPLFSGGSYTFTVPGPAGASIVVEASEDLIHWLPVQTNTAPFTFVDANAAQFTQRFYRVAILP